VSDHHHLDRPQPLCAAIVDRLTFGGNIIETGTDLLPARARQAPTRRAHLMAPHTQC